MQSAAAPAAEGYGGGISAPDAAHLKFSKKDVQVDWDKVSRVAPLVDQALGARSEEPAVVANTRTLEVCVCCATCVRPQKLKSSVLNQVYKIKSLTM